MSISQESGDAVARVTRTTQLIIGAEIAGVTFFLLIVLYLVHGAGFSLMGAPPGQAAAANAPGAPNPGGGQQAPQSMPLVTYICAAMAVTVLPLSFILPGVIATASLRSGAAQRPADGSSPTKTAGATPGAPGSTAAAFQTSAIIGGALAESAAFFGCVAYLIEQNPIALVVAAVSIAALVVQFPTRGRVERWIAVQDEKLRWGTTG
jgi:hypothetical protein